MYETRKTTPKQRQCTHEYKYKPQYIGVYVDKDVYISVYT